MNIINIIKEEVSRVLGESNRGYLNEIDWEGDFSDVKKKCIDINKIVDYLNRVRANAGKGTKDREKFNNEPIVHAKSKFFKDSDKGIDINYFIKKVTETPKYIIGKNSKMEKTGDRHTIVYKTGVPAIKGIVYDKEKDKFFYINTCPGAGSCVFDCYATMGEYLRFFAYDKMTRVLNYLLNEPNKYEEKLYQELKNACIEHKAFEGYKSNIIVRWNDSGDFFTKKYVEICKSVIDRLKKDGYNINSYAYTKVADVHKDSDLKTVFSSDSNKSERSKINFDMDEISIMVPLSVMGSLNLKKYSDEKIYKERVIKKYKLDPKYTITYDELIKKEDEGVPIWNVIVTPYDGDDAAFRNDVKAIYLAQHIFGRQKTKE